jgi:hypothetical protein
MEGSMHRYTIVRRISHKPEQLNCQRYRNAFPLTCRSQVMHRNVFVGCVDYSTVRLEIYFDESNPPETFCWILH